VKLQAPMFQFATSMINILADNMLKIIIIITYYNLHSAFFVVGCSNALYTENKDNYIKHGNRVQVEVNQVCYEHAILNTWLLITLQKPCWLAARLISSDNLFHRCGEE